MLKTIMMVSFLLIANVIGSELPDENNKEVQHKPYQVLDSKEPYEEEQLIAKQWQECGKDYLKESNDKCSVEKIPGYFSNIVYNIDKPDFFINFFTGIREFNDIKIINQTKEELLTLNKEKTKEYVRQISTLIYVANNNSREIHMDVQNKAEIKWLIWNRILLAKEAYEDFLNQRKLLNYQHYSQDYYMELVQISSIYNQLAKIKKEHIDQLWKTTEHTCWAVNKFEYDLWLQQRENPSVKFLFLLIDIFAPITNNVIPPQENFDKYFGA